MGMRQLQRGFPPFFISYILLSLRAVPESVAVPLMRADVQLPLSTKSRWIVDAQGQRVKLACTNWAAHLDTMVPEGLSQQPLGAIVKQMARLGFNCVRFTWALFMVTNSTLGSLTVQKSLERFNLSDAIAGIYANNRFILNFPLIEAYKAVVLGLAHNKLMVILDNHVSHPGWCCSNFDGDTFFGDQFFDPDLWISGLTRMANLFNEIPYVIGMSLRNELRGPKQRINAWYRFMQQGAEVVHSTNPNVLVILSGLYYDADLSFILKQPVNLTFLGKLVFELHWYRTTHNSVWVSNRPDVACGKVVDIVMGKGGFVLNMGWPLLISEFGANLEGTNLYDNRFLSCFFSVAANLDFEFAHWIYGGSYYIRQGNRHIDETYGLTRQNWTAIRNPDFLGRLSAIQSPFQGPVTSGSNSYNRIFHPQSGKCIVATSTKYGQVRLGTCTEPAGGWSYNATLLTLTVKGGRKLSCLAAYKIGWPARVESKCTGPTTRWVAVSNSKLQLASSLPNNSTVCLDVNSRGTIVTNACKCMGAENTTTCDPAIQWFKIINSTRTLTSTKNKL